MVWKPVTGISPGLWGPDDEMSSPRNAESIGSIKPTDDRRSSFDFTQPLSLKESGSPKMNEKRRDRNPNKRRVKST